MSVTWNGAEPPRVQSPGLRGVLRILRRGLPMFVLIFGGAVVLVLVRLIERPVFGLNRPWTPRITRFACRNALRLMGLRLVLQGEPMQGQGAVVANHSSWLDIFVLNASDLIYFVSKAEVSKWPGIGWLAKITGTVFIERDPRQAGVQAALFETRLLAGHRLLFFPEGSSTDNQRVLPFKSSLFAAFRNDALRDTLSLQPVSVSYVAPDGEAPLYYGWWGDMEFAPNLIKLLATPRHGHVKVTYHAPIAVNAHPDRKSLAAACEHAVRGGLEHAPAET